jgi:hypothetical protein
LIAFARVRALARTVKGAKVADQDKKPDDKQAERKDKHGCIPMLVLLALIVAAWAWKQYGH